jgi:hypothetical protein
MIPATGIRVRSESAGSMANCLCLGVRSRQSTVSKYTIRHRGPPSHWRTLLRSHAIGEIAPAKLSHLSRFRVSCFIQIPKSSGLKVIGCRALYPASPQAPKRLRLCVCVRVCEYRRPRRGYIAGVFLCKVSEESPGRRPIWPISKPTVHKSSLGGKMMA